jgi:hypothetical protein
MRSLKKDEEEIVLMRPQWYAAKTLREKNRLALQPPYKPSDDTSALSDMNGDLIKQDFDSYQNIGK